MHAAKRARLADDPSKLVNKNSHAAADLAGLLIAGEQHQAGAALVVAALQRRMPSSLALVGER